MRFGLNISSLFAQRNLGSATDSLAKSTERLASGLRIIHASDDAAGLAIASQLNSNARIYGQALRNANDGISILNVAEGGLSQLQEILSRQLELATQAASSQFGTQQRTALQNESNQLTAEYNRIVATTAFNGRILLDGSSGTIQLQVGTNGQNSSSISLALTGLLQSLSSSPGVTTASSGTAEQDSIDFTSALRHANVTFLVPDGASISNGDGFSFTTYVGGVSQDHYVWFNVDGGGSVPGGPGTGHVVSISSSDNTTTVAANIAAALSAVAGTSVAPIGGSVQIINTEAGDLNLNDIGSYEVYLGLVGTTGRSIQPSDYLLFSTPSTNYYLWFNNGAAADPGIAGRTGIQVNYAPTQDSATLLANVVSAINAAGMGLTVGTAGLTLNLTNTVNGAVTAPSSSWSGGSYFTRPTIGTNTAIDTSAETLTIASHGYSTGQQVTASSSGTLPGGLSAGTYFVIAVDGNTIKLASSLANAQSGTAINLTSYGTGTTTLTPSGTPVSTSTASLSNLDLSTVSGARTALTTLTGQANTVSTFTSSIGATQSRLGSVIQTLQSAKVNVLNAAARISEADIASESANVIRQQILQQANAAVLSHINLDYRLVLDLLK